MSQVVTPNPTSLAHYYEHVMSGKASTQRARIYEFLVSMTNVNTAVCRNQIARWFSRRLPHPTIHSRYLPTIPLASVCGRVHALIEAGFVEVVETKPETEGNPPVEWLKAVIPAPEQRTFNL